MSRERPMDGSVTIRTIVPILILIGLGYLSRRINILRAGDERVLNAYVYFFALPSLFLIGLSELDFTYSSLDLVSVGIFPILAMIAICAVGYWAHAYSRGTFHLLVVSSIFGSTSFFGIPFIVFAFPQAENLATLSSASISIVSVPIVIALLEIHKEDKSSLGESLKRVGRRLLRNPLVISIALGVLLSILGLRIPSPFSDSLHMVGSTTSAVAIFILGVFLYGRTYNKLSKAFLLSLSRAVVLPGLAFLFARLVGLADLDRTTVVMMHSTPLAISMIVLSERYEFHRETVSSLLLVSSLAAGIWMNIWLVILGY